MAEVYAGCHTLLRPGGLLVAVTKSTAARGGCSTWPQPPSGWPNKPGPSICSTSFWQLDHLRRCLAKGEPAHLVAHEDVLVFAKPEDAHG